MGNILFKIRSWVNGLPERIRKSCKRERTPSGEGFDALMFRLLIFGIILAFISISYFVKGYLFYKDEIKLNEISMEQLAIDENVRADINMCQGPVYEWNMAGGKRYLYVIPMGTDSVTDMFLEIGDAEDGKDGLDGFVCKSNEYMEKNGNLYQMDKMTVRGKLKKLPSVYHEVYQNLQARSGYAKKYIPYYIDFESVCDGQNYIQMGKYSMIAAIILFGIWCLGQKTVSAIVRFIMQ